MEARALRDAAGRGRARRPAGILEPSCAFPFFLPPPISPQRAGGGASRAREPMVAFQGVTTPAGVGGRGLVCIFGARGGRRFRGGFGQSGRGAGGVVCIEGAGRGSKAGESGGVVLSPYTYSYPYFHPYSYCTERVGSVPPDAPSCCQQRCSGAAPHSHVRLSAISDRLIESSRKRAGAKLEVQRAYPGAQHWGSPSAPRGMTAFLIPVLATDCLSLPIGLFQPLLQ